VAGQSSNTMLFVDFDDIATARQVRADVSGTALPTGAVVTVYYARPPKAERESVWPHSGASDASPATP
jgi:hypothetical protein